MKQIASWEWAFYLAIAPIVTFPSLFDERIVLLVLVLLPLSWLLRKLARGYFFPPTPLDWSLVLFSLMVLVSLLVTPDLVFSAPKGVRVVYGIAVLYAVVCFVGQTPKRLYWVTVFFLLVGVGIAAAGLLGTSWVTKPPFAATVSRFLPQRFSALPGTDGGFNPNEVAGVLLLAAPLAIGLSAAVLVRMVQGRGKRKRTVTLLLICGAVAIFLGGTIVLMQSWGAYVALLASLILMGSVGLWKRQWLAITFLIVLGIGMTLGFQLLVVEPDTTSFEASLEALLDNKSPATLESREEIWVRAINGIEDFSLTGMGLNSFRMVVPIFYPLFSLPPNGDISHAHNQLLQAGVDLGIPGMIAYLGLWLGAIGMLVRVWLLVDEFWLRATALGLGGSLVSFFVFGLADAVALGARPGFLFWLLMGLVTSLHAVVVWQADERQRKDSGWDLQSY